jgi:hypothetical protein
MTSPFSDTQSITSIESVSVPPAMTSPFSDTESIISIESADSGRTVPSSPYITSSRTSLDSLDEELHGLSDEDITQITHDLQQATANVGAGIEAVDSRLTKATVTTNRVSAGLMECKEMLVRIETQLPAFLERRRAMAQAAAERHARRGFFGKVVDKVKGRVSGWMV